MTSHATLVVSDVCLANSAFEVLWSYASCYCIDLCVDNLWNQDVYRFYFYCRHIGLATKTDQTIFGVDPKLHTCIKHLAHEWKYCIIVQFEINTDLLIDWFHTSTLTHIEKVHPQPINYPVVGVLFMLSFCLWRRDQLQIMRTGRRADWTRNEPKTPFLSAFSKTMTLTTIRGVSWFDQCSTKKRCREKQKQAIMSTILRSSATCIYGMFQPSIHDFIQIISACTIDSHCERVCQ